MSGGCPNPNSEAWKELAAELGEERAHVAFVRNGHKVPTVEEGQRLTKSTKDILKEQKVATAKEASAAEAKKTAGMTPEQLKTYREQQDQAKAAAKEEKAAKKAEARGEELDTDGEQIVNLANTPETFGSKAIRKLFDKALPILDSLGIKVYQRKLAEGSAGTAVETALRSGHALVQGYEKDGRFANLTLGKKLGSLDDLVKKFGKDAINKSLDARRYLHLEYLKGLHSADFELNIPEAEQLRLRGVYDSIMANPAEKAAFNEINNWTTEWNRSFLDLGKASGLIHSDYSDILNPETYVPSYVDREVLADLGDFSPTSRQKIVNSMLKFKAGPKEKMQSPIAALVNNWSSITRNHLRNITNKEAAIEMGNSGWLITDTETKLPKKYEGQLGQNDRGVSFYDKGRLQHVRFKHNVGEEADRVFNALTANQKIIGDSFLLKYGLQKPKELLTTFATVSPGFREAIFLKDTMSTKAMTPGFSVLKAIGNLYRIMKDDPEYLKMLAAGGGYHFGWMRGRDAGTAIENYVESIDSKGVRSVTLAPVMKLVDFWRKTGEAVENASRLEIYENALRKEKSLSEAAFEARNIRDYGRTGASGSVQFLTTYTPFFNAYLQGLYKEGRTATDKETAGHFWMMAAGLGAAGAATYAANADKIKELPDKERALYWHFWVGDTHYRIPKPFELGIASTWAEDVTDLYLNGKDKTVGAIVKEFWSAVPDTFFAWGGYMPTNPLPPVAAPWADIAANKRLPSDSPIVPLGLQNKPPEEQYQPWTPEMYRKIGDATGTSPLQVEHVLRGYFASMADGAAFLTHAASRDGNTMPALSESDYPFLGRFMGGEARSTKYTQEFHETYQDIQDLRARVEHYAKEKDKAALKGIATDPHARAELKAESLAGAVRERDGELKKFQAQVSESPTLDPHKKREIIDRIQIARNKEMELFHEKLLQFERDMKAKQ